MTEEPLYEPTPLEAARLAGVVYVVVSYADGNLNSLPHYHGIFATEAAAERFAESAEESETTHNIWRILKVPATC